MAAAERLATTNVEEEVATARSEDLSSPPGTREEARRVRSWAALAILVATVGVAVVLMAAGQQWLPAALRSGSLSTLVAIVLLIGATAAGLVYTLSKNLSLQKLSDELEHERRKSDELSRRLADTSRLSAAATAMSSTLDFQALVDVVLTSALELIGGTAGSVALLDDSGNMEIAGVLPSQQGAEGGSDTSAADARRAAVERRKPVLVRGDSGDSSISCPLMRRGELLGALTLSERGGGRTFTEHDLKLLEVFSEHAAIAIRNARLFERERETVTHLEEVDRLKSDFVATVSHELRTPLTAVIGAAKTLSRKGDRMDAEQHASFIDMIHRQAERLFRLVDDVLTASRIEAGLPTVRREIVDLRDVAETVVADVRSANLGSEHEIILHTEPDRPRVWGDPDAVRQILANLIENALKYSGGEGKITISVSETDAEAVLEVRDEGQGISPENISTIFDRFRQVEMGAARRSSGFGLGLFIVKTLVEAHRGHVEVDSEVGVGTTFRVHLPQRPER